MYWRYVVEICCRDMSQVYVVDIRCGYTLVASVYGYAVDIRWLHRCRYTLVASVQTYVAGIHYRHTLVASAVGVRQCA